MITKPYRSRAAAGLILILLGLWFLAVQLSPDLRGWVEANLAWPVIVIGVGAAFLVIGLITGAPQMAVPASIIAGIGGILYWQELTGRYETWSYAWTLIPGFVGIGVILANLLGDTSQRRDIWGGVRLLLISSVLFFAFGSLMGDFDLLRPYLPIVLIVVGLVFFVRALIRRD